jgi:arylsulfatase A-like enzyme
MPSTTSPNLLFVFADQWRAQATGFAGNPAVRTPHLDRFAAESVVFTNAVSGCPVCSPWRASLMTGQYPHRHGMVVNDQCLAELADGPFLAEAFNAAGYHTAYVGKWHVDGHGRKQFVPPERRLGFQSWAGCECTHRYHASLYYRDDDPTPRQWSGYDARAQTAEVGRFLADRPDDRPFAMFLSWGPPHAPYPTAPPEFQAMVRPQEVPLRPNVPEASAEIARKELAGYYAHCSALDACFGQLLADLDRAGLSDDTIVVFTSDHGDLLHSHGQTKKQQPYAEACRVPMVVRDPRRTAPPATVDTPIDAPDLMPTMLALCGGAIPHSVQGRDLSACIRLGQPMDNDALLACYVPFHQWNRPAGGREFRGLHTTAHTYVRDLAGPWLLFDNAADPYQLHNLANEPALADLRAALDVRLDALLQRVGDDVPPGDAYFDRFHVRLDDKGDVYYR